MPQVGPRGNSGRATAEQAEPATSPGRPTLLEALECRIRDFGEEPHFREVEPGKLVHLCRSFRASICFWPVSLLWRVDGDQSGRVDALLMKRTGSPGQEAADTQPTADATRRPDEGDADASVRAFQQDATAVAARGPPPPGATFAPNEGEPQDEKEDADCEVEGAAMTAADASVEPEAKRSRPAAPAPAPASTASEATVVQQSPAHVFVSAAQPPLLKRRRMRKKGPGPQPGHDPSPEQRLLSSCPPAPAASAGAPTALHSRVPSRKGLTIADVAGSWCPTSAPRGGGGTAGSPPAQPRIVESTGTDSKARISGEDRDSRPCSRA